MDELRKIIHIDMDAFYASVEQHDRPELRGKPIAIGHDGTRGVVATASYEARPYGVRSAQPISAAKRLCPDLIIVSGRHERYREISEQIHSIFHEYTDIIEPISLDEAFLDVTENKKKIAYGVDVAKEIKRRIREVTGLTASAGISYNKLLAKIASDWRKPDGLYTIHPDRALDFISRLPIEKLWGVGEKTARRMHGLGIFTCADLRNVPLGKLQDVFGKAGRMFYDFARGVDNRPVVYERIRKSVGCEQTFLEDIYELSDVMDEINRLSADLAGRISNGGFEGHTLTLKVKYGDFSQITRSMTVDNIVYGQDEIHALAKRLLVQVEFGETKPIRLLGLTVSNPSHEKVSEIYPYGIQLEIEWSKS